jgi:hypothetical protein
MSSLCGLCLTSIQWMLSETIAVAHHSCILSVEAKAPDPPNSDRVIPVRVPPEHTPAASRTALLLCPADRKILSRRFPVRRVQRTGDLIAQPFWLFR